MAANPLSKFFGIGKKNKATKSKTQNDDSEDDEGYIDPTEACSTEPPVVSRTSMPNYPPPRPNSPKSAGKKIPAKRLDDYQDPWDSKKQFKNKSDNKQSFLPPTDYEDPFDAKFKEQKRNVQVDNNIDDDDDDDEYSEPYEPVINKNIKSPPTDTYEDPWDTRKNTDISNHIQKPVNTGGKSPTVNIQKAQVRRDDYSDPWDSKEASSVKSTEDDDDTYSDPYDTDKPTILDGSKRVSRMDDNNDDDDDLYDIPEDEKAIILPNSKNGVTSNSKTFNSLPQHAKFNQNPSKPPNTATKLTSPSATLQSQGDYDSPWEWQAKNVEEEFAKRFSIGEAPQQPVAPPRKKSNSPNDLIKSLNNVNPIAKPQRNTFKTDQVSGPKAYEIDPTIPLDNQGWFHGRIRRGDAELLLKALPDCSYLIRNSESSKLDYSLSLRNHGETMHLKISCRDSKYILGMNSRPYDTIPDMIHHYSMNKLNIRGAEHVKLQYPVLQEAMYFTVEPGT